MTKGTAAPDTRHGVILYLDSVTVSFDGFRALNDLSLTIDEGELRCLIGPNGAGKTTLMDLITGRTTPDQGSVWYGQRQNLATLDEAAIARLGIGRKFQKPTVFEPLSVRENLALALAADRRVWPVLRSRSRPAQADAIDALLERIGLAHSAGAGAATLSHGQKQWLELGMLLAQQPRLLLVDEPVAGMTGQETERTAALLNDLAGDHTVIVVEHDMAFVRKIARTVTVLHEGAVLAEGSLDAMQAHPEVTRVYLGE